MKRGHTDLESGLFVHWRNYLHTCDRSQVQLVERLFDRVRQGFETRRAMTFREAPGAPYAALNALDFKRFFQSCNELFFTLS